MAATLVPVSSSPAPAAGYSREQIDLIKSQVAVGVTDDELRLFLYQASRTGLDPLTRQIYAIVRKSKYGGHRMTIQISVDGFRLVAQRSGEYRGQLGPFWCGPDGRWVDVWLEDTPPVAAKVGVLRANFVEAVYGVARTAAYAARDEGGRLAGLWRTMPDTMIAKCAEVLALRKAFPHELSGVYAADELEGGGLDREPATVDRMTGELAEPAAREPAPMVADELEPAALPERTRVKVKGIVKRPIKGGHKYVVTGADDQAYHTFSVSTATAAKVAQEAGIAVEILYLPSKYGRMIQSLHEPDTAPEPPL
jgi:phage recombination protein Bet